MSNITLIVVFVCLILQEVQLILTHRRIEDLEELIIAALMKDKKVKKIIIDNTDIFEDDDEDEE